MFLSYIYKKLLLKNLLLSHRESVDYYFYYYIVYYYISIFVSKTRIYSHISEELNWNQSWGMIWFNK